MSGRQGGQYCRPPDTQPTVRGIWEQCYSHIATSDAHGRSSHRYWSPRRAVRRAVIAAGLSAVNSPVRAQPTSCGPMRPFTRVDMTRVPVCRVLVDVLRNEFGPGMNFAIHPPPIRVANSAGHQRTSVRGRRLSRQEASVAQGESAAREAQLPRESNFPPPIPSHPRRSQADCARGASVSVRLNRNRAEQRGPVALTCLNRDRAPG
jgi:hypothetical protein